MLGAITGDIVGSRFEFDNLKSTEFELFHPDCTFTDDTICTIAVADWLMNPGTGLPDTMRYWCRKYPNPAGGYGSSFRQWIFSETGPYRSFGNGSAMRVSPAGWISNDPEVVRAAARQSAEITHNHPEGIKGACCVAESIRLLRNDASKNELKSFIESSGYKLEKNCDYIRQTNIFDETCQVTVPLSIRCFLESTDFESAIRLAVSIGGDSDTIAAITGSLAEAAYGIPDEIRGNIFRILPREMLEITRKFQKHQFPGMVK